MFVERLCGANADSMAIELVMAHDAVHACECAEPGTAGALPDDRQRFDLRPRAVVTSIFDFEYEHFTLHGYEPQPHIAAPVAV